MKARLSLSLSRLVALATLGSLSMLGLSGCDNLATTPPPRLKGPTDMVQAGPALGSGGGGQYLFVLGGRKNIVYVLNAETFGFVRAPNKYFPLEISVCQYPSAAAATSDGRFVFVGCGGSDAAYVLDATSLKLVRNDDGSPMSIALGSGVSQMLRSEVKTPTGGDRFYTLNTYSRSISVFETDSQNGVARPTITTLPAIENVGSIVRGVVTATTLYTADSTGPFVHRIDLSSGRITDFDVGAPSVDLALARNGSKLYVVSPTVRGITVVDTASGQVIDTSPRYAPQLPDDEAYGHIYIGDVPARVLVLDDQNTALTVGCSGGDARLSTVSSFALVASEAGTTTFIDATKDQIVDALSCVGPQAVPSTNTPNIFTETKPFVDCRNSGLPSRNTCIADTGLVVYPGFTPDSLWRLQYEPLVPGGDRRGGGGSFLDDNTLTDVGLDLSTLGLQVGDHLILVGDVRPQGDCLEFYGAVGNPARELSVTEVTNVQSRSAIRFAPAVRRECFDATAGAIDYQLRFGDAFLLSGAVAGQNLSPIQRLSRGGSFGANNDQAIRFSLRSDLQAARDQLFEFQVTANFSAVATGRISSAAGDVTAVGRVPTAISVIPASASGGRLGRAYVAFGANDAIISFPAFDTRLLNTSDLTLLIR